MNNYLIKKNMLITILFVTMCLCTSCGKTKINLSKYLELKYNGYNGNGSLSSVEIDAEKLALAIAPKASEDDLFALEARLYDIEFNYKTDKKLSNNDKLKISFNISEELVKHITEKYNVKLNSEATEITVKDLPEAVEIDPFEKFEFTVENYHPFLELKMSSTEIEGISFSYSCKEDINSLKPGDKFTVEASSNNSYLIEKNNYKIGKTTKEFEMPKYGSYVKKYEEIDPEVYNTIEKTAYEYLQSAFANHTKNYVKSAPKNYFSILLDIYSGTGTNYWETYTINNVGPLNLENVHFLYRKTPDTKSYNKKTQNYLYFIYSIEVDDSLGGKRPLYITMYCPDIVKYADGTTYVDYTTVEYSHDYAEYSPNKEQLDNALLVGNKSTFEIETIK